jgi:hypothetical protein
LYVPIHIHVDSERRSGGNGCGLVQVLAKRLEGVK